MFVSGAGPDITQATAQLAMLILGHLPSLAVVAATPVRTTPHRRPQRKVESPGSKHRQELMMKQAYVTRFSVCFKNLCCLLVLMQRKGRTRRGPHPCRSCGKLKFIKRAVQVGGLI